MYDIDDLIEPNRKKIRDPFAQSFDQVNKGHGNIWEYQVLGQESGYRTPKQSREYYEKRKGERAHIEYMSPNEYFDRVDKGFRSKVSADKQHEVMPQIPDNFRNPDLLTAAKKGSKFAMPFIEYNEGEFLEQEGRHRATMAKDLGIEKMPVVIIDRKREYRGDYDDYISPEEKNKKKNKNPFTYDDEELEVEF